MARRFKQVPRDDNYYPAPGALSGKGLRHQQLLQQRVAEAKHDREEEEESVANDQLNPDDIARVEDAILAQGKIHKLRKLGDLKLPFIESGKRKDGRHRCKGHCGKSPSTYCDKCSTLISLQDLSKLHFYCLDCFPVHLSEKCVEALRDTITPGWRDHLQQATDSDSEGN